jgi:hypothetical protein
MCDGYRKTRGVSHYGLAIYILKYLKAKEDELWKFKYFTMQKYNLQKYNPLKETKKSCKIYYNSETNLKVSTQAKISSFKKSSYKNK